MSMLCIMRGSYGDRVVRKLLPGECPGAPPPGRLVALRGRVVGFSCLVPSALHDSTVFWGSLACLTWSMSHHGPISCVYAQLPFCRSSAA